MLVLGLADSGVVLNSADVSVTNRLEQVADISSQDLNLLSRSTLVIFRSKLVMPSQFHSCYE